MNDKQYSKAIFGEAQSLAAKTKNPTLIQQRIKPEVKKSAKPVKVAKTIIHGKGYDINK